MTALYRDYGRTYLPFRLALAGDARARCSLGGAPPAGVTPPLVDASTNYFGTLGLEPGLDVSLFLTFDPAAMTPGPSSLVGCAYKLFREAIPFVQFVVHPAASAWSLESPLHGKFPRLDMVFETEGTDSDLELAALAEPGVYDDQKVGGVPAFWQLEGEVLATPALLRDGFVHLLQLLMPVVRIKYDWPFGSWVFHVFARRSGSTYEFRYIWG